MANETNKTEIVRDQSPATDDVPSVDVNADVKNGAASEPVAVCALGIDPADPSKTCGKAAMFEWSIFVLDQPVIEKAPVCYDHSQTMMQEAVKVHLKPLSRVQLVDGKLIGGNGEVITQNIDPKSFQTQMPARPGRRR